MDLGSKIHKIEIEERDGRVTGVVDGSPLFDTTRAKVLHERGLPDRIYVPLEDFDHSMLEESAHTSHCPFKGSARYFSIRAGDRLIEDAMWAYPEPKQGVAEIAGYASVYPEALDSS